MYSLIVYSLTINSYYSIFKIFDKTDFITQYVYWISLLLKKKIIVDNKCPKNHPNYLFYKKYILCILENMNNILRENILSIHYFHQWNNVSFE